MSSLEDYCSVNQRDPRSVMNELQGRGIVSDNAVFLEDVCRADEIHALEWLKTSFATSV